LKEDDENQKSSKKSSMVVTFEYNTLTEEYINGLLQEAISKDITSND
jgi:hypothetical protein